MLKAEGALGLGGGSTHWSQSGAILPPPQGGVGVSKGLVPNSAADPETSVQWGC